VISMVSFPATSSDPPPSLRFKVTVLFNGKYLKTVHLAETHVIKD